MPEAGQRPYGKQIENVPCGRAPVAAERDVHIVAEPGGQRDVPAAPELGDRLADVRIVEVFEKLEAEHFAETDRHIRVAGEIEVNLQRVANRAHPRTGGGQLARCIFEYAVRNLREHVGQQHLFAEPEQEAADTLGKLRKRVLSHGKLHVDIVVAYDRACNQLREHGDVQRQRKQIVLRRNLSAVYVNDVAERLKRVKRDADRHDNVRHRNAQSEQAVRRADEEIQILEYTQQAQIGDNTQNEQRFSVCTAHGQTEQVIHQYRKNQHADQPGFSVKIEEQAEQKQHRVPHADKVLRHDIIAEQHRR